MLALAPQEDPASFVRRLFVKLIRPTTAVYNEGKLQVVYRQLQKLITAQRETVLKITVMVLKDVVVALQEH